MERDSLTLEVEFLREGPGQKEAWSWRALKAVVSPLRFLLRSVNSLCGEFKAGNRLKYHDDCYY